MGKNSVKWVVKDGIMTCTHTELAGEPKQVFDIRKLYTMYDTFDEAQQGTACNGAKQRLADSTARDKLVKLTPQERFDKYADYWNMLSVERVYKREAAAKGPMVSLRNGVLASVRGNVPKDTARICITAGTQAQFDEMWDLIVPEVEKEREAAKALAAEAVEEQE